MTGNSSKRRLTVATGIQAGFTLIEALVAFVVLTVGLLGASLFHSQLLGEFTQSKAEYEASRIAEVQLEDFRTVLSTVSDASGVQPALLASINSPQSLNGIVYTVSLASISGPTSGGLVSFNLLIDWNSPDSDDTSRQLSYDGKGVWTLAAISSPDNVSLEPSSTTYEGNIPVPLGTLTRLNREARLVASLAADSVQTISSVVGDTGSVFRATDSDGQEIAGIKVGDDYVQLVRLSESDNEIFQLSGRILLDKLERVKVSGNTNLEFGCTYSGSTSSALCSSDVADDDVLDITATGGAGCLIYKVEDSPASYAIGSYTCLAGTGWNGQIQPYVLDVVTNGNGEDSVTSINGTVCAPNQRAYRYLIIDPAKVDNFETRFLSEEPKSLFDSVIASGAIVGQSGLVRFYQENDTNRSSEGVINESYFWTNPDYIVSAAAFSNTASYAYQVYENSAYESAGYNLPGDVAYQDFYIHGEKSGNSFVGCESRGLTEYINAVSAGHLSNPQAAKGMPGYNYVPSVGEPSLSIYSEDMFNRDYSNYSALVLGYTLSRFSINGTFSYPSSYSIDQFVLGGNPEPVISIECEFDSDTEVTTASISTIDYSCAVPTGWSGTLLAYLANPARDTVGDVVQADEVYAELDSDSGVSSGLCLPGYPYASVAEASLTDSDYLLSAYQLYFKALGSPTSTASVAYDFSGLYVSDSLPPIENNDITRSISMVGGSSCL